MAVHLHGMSGGGRYFGIAGVNPLLLEPLLNDPRLKSTNFVLLHGGWPYVREAGALLQKPNFFLDLSQQALILPARTLAGWLREWLETYPDKVLFGTDGYPYSPALGWEDATWLAARNARLALGLALTGMERDGEVSAPEAAELARKVLRGNAERLYQLRSASRACIAAVAGKVTLQVGLEGGVDFFGSHAEGQSDPMARIVSRTRRVKYGCSGMAGQVTWRGSFCLPLESRPALPFGGVWPSQVRARSRSRRRCTMLLLPRVDGTREKCRQPFSRGAASGECNPFSRG